MGAFVRLVRWECTGLKGSGAERSKERLLQWRGCDAIAVASVSVGRSMLVGERGSMRMRLKQGGTLDATSDAAASVGTWGW